MSSDSPGDLPAISTRRGISFLTVPSPVLQKKEIAALEAILGRMSRTKAVRCVLDLSSCEYISSEGLGLIARMWKSCHEQDGGSMAVVIRPVPHSEVRSLFDTIGLSRLLGAALVSTMEDAKRVVSKKTK